MALLAAVGGRGCLVVPARDGWLEGVTWPVTWRYVAARDA